MRPVAAAIALAAGLILVATAAAGGRPIPPLLATAGPQLVRYPDPLLTNFALDYTKPLLSLDGGIASLLGPSSAAVVCASSIDVANLEYQTVGDLGGFVPAPIGGSALTGPGRTLVGKPETAEVPHDGTQGCGGGESYTYAHGLPNGGHHVPHFGPPPPPPGSNSGAPGTNQCFSGCTTPPHRPPHPPGSPGTCGTPGLSIVSNLPHCRIYVVNQKPGDSTLERMTITNTSSRGYALYLHVGGTPNAFWDDLEMGVWQHGTPAPTPLPPLGFWTNGFEKLGTLKPGHSVRYTIELYLPPPTGNTAQRQTAKIHLVWRAVGTG